MNPPRNKAYFELHEFFRSQGAPSAEWLKKLNPQGQRKCIRQWIVKARSPEIAPRLADFADQIFHAKCQEHPYCPETPEELEEYVRARRKAALDSLEEKIRYGAIDIDQIDSPRPWEQYSRYQRVCDEEWKDLVEVNRSRGSLIRWVRRLYAVLAVFFALEALDHGSIYFAIAAAAIGGCVLLVSPR